MAVLAGGALVAGRSSLFAVDRIRVVGESHLGARAVIRLAGIGPDANVLFLDPGAIERRLQADPWIRRATVERTYPSTVTIRVEERTPVAAVPRDGGYAVVAGDGTLLAYEAAPPSDLPLIVAEREVPTAVGPAPRVEAPARALAALPAGLRARVARAVVLPDGTVSLELLGGARILFGTQERASEKARVAEAILRWGRAEGVDLSVVDVRSPRSPAARPA
ncbi:MAG TPA: FtsQ-type POTRA domain-containing protein [Actinomycetota bacterium]|nr:FtsQ-type POTRA domain-containing protein [Actinomycetota bacterium]